MKIKIVIMIMFFLVALLGGIGGTSYYYVQSNQAMNQQVFNHLENVAQSRANHIETELKMEKEVVQSLALIGGVEKLLLAYANNSTYPGQKLNVETRLQKTVDSIEQIIHINLANKFGTIIAGTNPAILGDDKSTDPIFTKLKDGKIAISDVRFHPENENLILIVASPVKIDGRIVGFVFMRIDAQKSLFPILFDKTGLGETGETYLINKENYAISPLLFVEEAPLKWKVDSINSRNCLNMLGNPLDGEIEHLGHEPVEIYLDYRGQRVVGAHYPLPEMNWCLLAEINEEEILGRQRHLFQRVSLIIIIALVLIITLVGFFIGKFLDKRVVLKKGNKNL